MSSSLPPMPASAATDPQSTIVAFEQDEEGAWVARLACGHGRHVRHEPPFRVAPWVTTAAGRAERLGMPMPCRFCRMPPIPDDARVYKTTASFDAQSVPAGLLSSHALKEQTWARIVVEAGRVAYTLEDEGDLTLILRPGVPGTVAPERPHHVALQPGARFHVEFLRRQTR